MKIYFVCFILIVGNFTIFSPTKVHAEDLIPICDSGHIEGDSMSSTFKIVLYCQNISIFSNSGTTTADSLDLTRISLQPDGHAHNPLSAVINGDTIEMLFYASDGSADRDIKISQGAIESADSFTNLDILVVTDTITDFELPYATDDYYEINQPELSVSAADGVIKNDVDYEGAITDCYLYESPLHGTLTLNSDGSFVYTRDDGYYGDDQFSYFPVDASANPSTYQAVVYITDSMPEIISTSFYKKDAVGVNKIKVGETLRVEVETSEVVALSSMAIAGSSVVSYGNTDDTHYYFDYIMQDSDTEGALNYSFTIQDLSGKTKSYSSEDDSILFNRTPPMIDLYGDENVEISLHDDYHEDAKAMDDTDGEVDLSVSGLVSKDVAGFYTLTYNAVDSFGNQAITRTRTVHVVDFVADEFNVYSMQLRDMGFANNLDSVNMDNLHSFSGLYIENVVDGLRYGRITFNNVIDMENPDLIDFLLNIDQYAKIDDFGVIGLDFGELSADFVLRNRPAVLSFYNLNRLGYTYLQTASEIYANLNVYDDSGELLEKSSIIASPGSYNACVGGQNDCYVYNVQVGHFTKFVIGDYIPPIPGVDFSGQTATSISAVGNAIVAFNAGTMRPGLLAAHDYYHEGYMDFESTASSSDVDEILNEVSNNQKVDKKVEFEALSNNSEFVITWYWWFLSVIVLIGTVWWVVFGRKK